MGKNLTLRHQGGLYYLKLDKQTQGSVFQALHFVNLTLQSKTSASSCSVYTSLNSPCCVRDNRFAWFPKTSKRSAEARIKTSTFKSPSLARAQHTKAAARALIGVRSFILVRQETWEPIMCEPWG